MLADGKELALVDVREELIFSKNHLLLARSIPLSRLELKFVQLVPRRGTRVVLCDDDDGLAARAAAILLRNGYTDVAVLDGGVAAWAAAGLELFSGVNVPSKAFGEFIEHANHTPGISAGELEQLIREGADIAVLDSRPFDEYARVSIPTAINVPGAELVFRAREVAPSPKTTVVVNCAGRTRSIIGAQSLINAGLPNKVVALRNGTMGWSLAGFTCDSGKNRRAPGVSERTLEWARQAAQRVAVPAASPSSIAPNLMRFERMYSDRLSVRRPRSRRIPGGPCPRRSVCAWRPIGAGDGSVCRHAGRALVLVDDAEVRALMTASWLRQMGWRDVFVLAGRERRLAGRWLRRSTPNLAMMQRSTSPSLAICLPVMQPPSSICHLVGTTSKSTFPAPGLGSVAGSIARLRKFRCGERWCSRLKMAF